jgi:hypothetical protein
MRRSLTLTLVVTIAAAIGCASARAAGIDQTCELTATRFDPDTINVLFPDQSAQYWTAAYTAVPGTRIRIDGVFPYARYTSWNVYDPLLRPFAKKSDFQLMPDAGSSNPFLPGAARMTPVSQRHYTLYITFSASDKPGPNVIFVDPRSHPAGVFTLRVYVPDAGRDITGGVGLPQVTWEPTSSSGSASTSPCRTLEKPSSNVVTAAYAQQNGPATGPPWPGRTPPRWHRFVNLCQSGADLLLDNALGDLLPKPSGNPCGAFGSGGFLSNLDNAYVYAFISRGFGPIVVFHGLAPTFAATYPAAQTMPSGEQVRYWSLCQNDPIDQRYVGCRRDDQVTLDSAGTYTIVVSPPGSWPAAAVRRCSGTTTWIPWGPQPDGVMIYRQMLPDPSFTQAIQNVAYGSEQRQMGAYYPAGRYFRNWTAVARAYC